MCGNNGEACACSTGTTKQDVHLHTDHGSAVHTELGVQGMTCSHCVSSVTEELSALPGVRGVKVDLAAGGISTVTVMSDDALDADQVSAAIDEAGYTLADLPR
jgi:copper chaperone